MLLDEFKKFMVRGNLADLAVGFTVGAAFTTVAKSLVNDIIMPVVGLLIGSLDFKDMFVVLKPGGVKGPYVSVAAAQEAGAVTLNYGVFVNNTIALVLVAVVMFLLLRGVNRIKDDLADDDGQDDHKPAEPDNKKCRYCRSTVQYRATRCPFCTSELPTPPELQAELAAH